MAHKILNLKTGEFLTNFSFRSEVSATTFLEWFLTQTAVNKAYMYEIIEEIIEEIEI